ncbi:hypothetical protein C7B67_18810 [filamentous cyanobacterium Phorm 6]|nr:hypothetical protein C7B67_18810 [filamentous cyanobacterium Phorm 6]
MKRIISSVLVLGVCLTPLTMPVMMQPSWAQSQDSEVERFKQLIEQAEQQQEQGQPRQAIETWQQILVIVQQFKARKGEAIALSYIALNYNSIAQPQEALKYYNQALPITRKVGDRAGEVATLSNIEAVNNRSQPLSRINIPPIPK